jgi:hypothetical protein
MTYELKIDLLGGEKVEEILSKLKGLTGALGKGGSVFGGGSSESNKPYLASQRFLDDLKRGGKAAQQAGRDVATALAQGKGSGVSAADWILGKDPSFINRNPALISMLATKKFGGFSGAADNPVLKKFREDLSAIRLETAKGLITMSPANRAKTLRSGAELIKELVANNPDLGEVLQNNTLRMAAGWDKTALAQEAKANAQPRGRMQVNLADALKKRQDKEAKDAVTFKKDMSFLLMPLFNPGSMWATMFSARQTFSALNTEHGKAFMGKLPGGMAGLGAGGATALLVGAATAAGLALKGLAVVVKETVNAFETARQLYAKSLTSGMGLGFTAKRSLVAQIMGVSETEVFRFGAQLSYLNPKLEDASRILAATARPLTKVSWEWKILQADLSATFALIAQDAAPAIMGFLQSLDALIKWFNDHSDFLKLLVREEMAVATMGLSELYRAMFSKTAASTAASNMPSPAAWMKQLPASSWEKMGLVVGPSANNYAKTTAHNTTRMARDLSTVAKFITRNGGTVGNSPGAQWAMSMISNNP